MAACVIFHCMSDWHRLFPDEDFRFRMGLRPGDATAFFAPSAGGDSLLKHRSAALAAHPHRHVAALDGALPMIEEAADQMAGWSGTTRTCATSDPLAVCIEAGRTIEPDWVLLSPDVSMNHPVVAGVVCFPSSWSLPEKTGLPIGDVHQPAPTVNASLGRSIDSFLNRLNPGEAWQRENWGLSADDALDHHPDITVLPLTGQATLATTWLRLESQLLTRLPKTLAILFGIRVTTHRLDTLAAIPGLASRIARALRTMPADIASYKGLERCRNALGEALARHEKVRLR